MNKTKVAVVTGANKGLGLAIVRNLCKNYDGKVYLTSRDKSRGQNACEELNKYGLIPEYFQLDITDQDSIERFARHVQDQNEEIEFLFNNAALLFLKDASETILHQAQRTLEVNFFSQVNFTERVIPLVKSGGKIINVSSSSGHLSRLPSERLRDKFKSEELTLYELKKLMSDYLEAVKANREFEKEWGQSPYVVSKVGLNAYTFMLSRRLASKDIAVMCVHPGYVMSDMTRGVGDVTPASAAEFVSGLALRPSRVPSGVFVWHNGTVVPWDGPDPRGYIDKANK